MSLDSIVASEIVDFHTVNEPPNRVSVTEIIDFQKVNGPSERVSDFEIVDFGNQPLLSGENDAAFFSILYLPEEGRARACSHKTNDG